MPQNLRSLFDASRRFGARDLLVYEEERLTFEAHWRAASAFGRALSDRLGVGKGDRVAIAMRNYPEWSICAWGALAIGAVLVPLNAWESGRSEEHTSELQSLMRISSAVFCLTKKDNNKMYYTKN